ncbi:Putative periplasmic protein [Campylobacter coli]|nr:Putative periplasmic protein [Campylobacter coli]
MVGEFILDERITHLVGGLAYNGKVEKNKLNLNGVEFNIHAPSGLYSSFAPVHIAGAFVDGNGKKLMMQPKTPLL